MKGRTLFLAMAFAAGVGSGLIMKWSAPAPAHGASQKAESSRGIAAAGPRDFVELSKKIVPSVVNISTLSFVKNPRMGGPGTQDDLFRQFFEDFFRQHGGRGFPGPGIRPDQDEEGEEGGLAPDRRGSPRAMSLGTGFIIDASGLILTNNHVVAGADEIKVYFTEETDEKPTDATVVGRDPELDLALIRVKSKRKMVPLPFGNSADVQVGEYVIAVGNPFGQGHSVTHGIISAKGRIAPDFILANYLQTDAPINPGNSGGPLVNMKGEVIGINNAIEARAQGIGFAIPIDLAKAVLPELKTKGTVSRGYIGVLIEPLNPDTARKLGLPEDTRAPLVTQAVPGEPASKAGIQPYDVILEFNGKQVNSPTDLVRAVTASPVNKKVPVIVWRSGKRKQLSIQVGKRPGAEDEGKSTQPEKKKPQPSHLDVGMELQELTPEIARELGVSAGMEGVVVSSTKYAGAADRAGLMRGDVILEVDRKPVKGVDGFYSIVKDKNKSYLLRVRRSDPQGRDAFTVVVLDPREEKKPSE